MSAFKHQFELCQDLQMALWDQTIAKKSKLVTDRSLSKADRYSRANQRRPFVRTNHKVSLADRPLTANLSRSV
jgi:hypothetical protein